MHIALLVSQAGWELEQTARHLFRPHGLSPAQFNILNLLAPQSGGMRASDLAGQLVVDPSNITRLLARMQREGWLAAVPNPADRRQHVVRLTPAGRKLWAKAEAAYHRALASIALGLSPAQITAAEQVLGVLRQRSHELRS